MAINAASFLDMEAVVKEHKTRADVMTIGYAVAHHKSSKNHKLKPRSRKRDVTKTADAKKTSQLVKRSRALKAGKHQA